MPTDNIGVPSAFDRAVAKINLSSELLSTAEYAMVEKERLNAAQKELDELEAKMRDPNYQTPSISSLPIAVETTVTPVESDNKTDRFAMLDFTPSKDDSEK